MVYNINLINSISHETIKNNKLPDNVVSIINSLSEKVLSPTYSKTPIFKKKNTFNYNKFTQFSSTQIIKNKNILNDIKCFLNKLSITTQGEISKKINNELESATPEDKKKIVELLFNLKTTSPAFIKIYANIINNLNNNLNVHIFEIVNNIINKEVELFQNTENYDEMCKYNETLDILSSQYILILELVKLKKLESFFIENLFDNIRKTILNRVQEEDYKSLIEYNVKQYCKLLNLVEDTMDIEDKNKFVIQIMTLCSLKKKNKGLSNKTGFIIMDYCDENGLEY